jgi:hypothetical protein
MSQADCLSEAGETKQIRVNWIVKTRQRKTRNNWIYNLHSINIAQAYYYHYYILLLLLLFLVAHQHEASRLQYYVKVKQRLP